MDKGSSTSQGEIKFEQRNKVSFFRLFGAIEIMRSLQLEELIKNNVSEKDPRIVFDMSGVSHLSSSGIRVLLATLRQVNDMGGQLVLCSLNIVVRKMVETIELDQLFKIYENCEEAYQDLNR